MTKLFQGSRKVLTPVAVLIVIVLVAALVAFGRWLIHAQHAREYHGQLGQDLWVLEKVFPGVKDGYFVDVGSGDGERISNTWSLEAHGWTGVCIDPFPTNMERRSCKVFEEVVYGTTGKKVQFRTAGLFGGIDALIPSRMRQQIGQSRTVEFTTVTLDDLLARAGAPRFIHYVSIDVEGAELEVLKGFSLSRYRVGAFTIEHNFEQPKRTEIRNLLERNGYRLAANRRWDDWYVPKDPSWGEPEKAAK
jgi:FkbM family methyltransferase